MARYHSGANYENQSHLQGKDRMLGEALDDIASQVAVLRTQGNFGQKGAPSPPSAPSAINVIASSGLFTATIAHNNPPAGTHYVLQYSTTPNFQSPISEVLQAVPGIPTAWMRSLPNQALYFRVAAKFPASALGAWVYMGSAASPVMVA